MTDPFDLDRFAALADAYGGAVSRWPADRRAAAERLARTPEGAAILARAAALDARLDEWSLPLPSPALTARIAAGGTATWSGARLGPWLRWWPGIGVAATLAGVAAGSAAVATVAPVELGAGSTSFGDVGGLDDPVGPHGADR